jgi:DNA polymerase-1
MIDLPALWAILDMQPIRIDVDAWIEYSDDMLERGLAIQDSLGFNVKSQPQVQAALKKTGLKMRAKTSCDSAALSNWKAEADARGLQTRSALIGQIQEARKLRDAASKYGRRWIETNVENKEWVYPNWKVTGAKTGRMSCSDPNMQNIPAREMPIYRSFFPANDGSTMVISDVAQQEPRFSAFLLTKELEDEVDLHQRAADHFGLRSRAHGKTINLGLNYGMSAQGLAGRLGISIDEAETGLRNRRRHYSRYHAWQERQRRLAERLGYIVTASGRRVWVNQHNNQWSRNAINAPIQGSAADQTKLALVYIHEQCSSKGIAFPVTMIVHDEIVAQAPRGTVSIYRKIIKDAWMEAGKKLMPTIPTVVEIKKGKTWLDGK